VRTIDGGERGMPTPEQVRESYVTADLHRPGTGLLCLENTHNSKGGIAIDPERVDAAADAAHGLDVPVHVDGARVFNAAVALDVPASRIVENVDSVMFCLSKGLGAPVGSMLAGSEAFIDRARRTRKLFGGGMRQAGIIAAPGLEALESVDRLAEDHENARLLADGLDAVDGLSVQPPETNIVLVETSGTGTTAEEFVVTCESAGVRCVEFGETVARFCTHRNVDREDVETAVERVEAALA
jgi:threonine aldolase